MTATTHIDLDDLVELDEREGDGIRVTLLWNRATNRLSVLVSDERANDAFALEVREGDDPLDVFRHPFAYAAHRLLDEAQPIGSATCA